MLEKQECLVCKDTFFWDPTKESAAARLLCSFDWEQMRRYYQKLGAVIRTGQFYYDDHVHAYITHLEALRLKNVRSESGS